MNWVQRSGVLHLECLHFHSDLSMTSLDHLRPAAWRLVTLLSKTFKYSDIRIQEYRLRQNSLKVRYLLLQQLYIATCRTLKSNR